MLSNTSVARQLKVSLVVLASFVLFSSGGFAQSLPPAAYDHLEKLADQLKDVANKSRDNARTAVRKGGNAELASSIDRFASRASDLHDRIGKHLVAPSALDPEVNQLIADARSIRSHVLSQPPLPEADYGSWDRTLTLLSALRSEYQADLGRVPRAVGSTGRVPARTGRISPPNPLPNVRTMLGDLDSSAARAVELGQDNASVQDYLPTLTRFKEQVDFLREQYSNLTPAGRRENVERLLTDARQSQADLAHRQISPELRDAWDSVTSTLADLQDRLGGRTVRTTARGAVGTSGTTAPLPGTPDIAALSRDLDNRVARAAEGADQLTPAAADASIDRFRGGVRDFARRAAALSPVQRRERVERLLDAAQRAQRDLARRGAPAQLMDQWNGVVDVLLRLREAS